MNSHLSKWLKLVENIPKLGSGMSAGDLFKTDCRVRWSLPVRNKILNASPKKEEFSLF